MTPEFVTKNKDKALQRLLWELRNLRPDDGYYYSANYLLRAVIERVLYLYADNHKKYRPRMTDNQLIAACIDALLNKDGVDQKKLQVMRTAGSNTAAAFSLDALGAAVHAAQVPSRPGLIAVWDNWEPSLKMMLDLI